MTRIHATDATLKMMVLIMTMIFKVMTMITMMVFKVRYSLDPCKSQMRMVKDDHCSVSNL